MEKRMIILFGLLIVMLSGFALTVTGMFNEGSLVILTGAIIYVIFNAHEKKSRI